MFFFGDFFFFFFFCVLFFLFVCLFVGFLLFFLLAGQIRCHNVSQSCYFLLWCYILGPFTSFLFATRLEIIVSFTRVKSACSYWCIYYSAYFYTPNELIVNGCQKYISKSGWLKKQWRIIDASWVKNSIII